MPSRRPRENLTVALFPSRVESWNPYRENDIFARCQNNVLSKYTRGKTLDNDTPARIKVNFDFSDFSDVFLLLSSIDKDNCAREHEVC